MDGHIGQILDTLKAQGVLEDTAIIVTSDHGENFGELGVYSEHGTADNITCRIPMIIRWPGGKQGHTDDGFHYNIDLAPTMAELLGTQPWDKWDGRSYAASLMAGEETGRDDLILSQGAHVCQRSVRWDNWLYMRTYHDGFRPHFGEEMLFDVVADPHEIDDLVATKPDVLAEGQKRLAAWHASMMASMPFGETTDPMDTVLAEGGPMHANDRIPLKGYTQRLRDTGRGHWIEKIKERHPEADL
jgi:choline-sulfatase